MLLEVVEASKRFPAGGSTLTVFEKLTLQATEGTFLTIVGPSGCGKSTLLKMMAGLETPTEGLIRFRGSTVERPPAGVIYVFQQYGKSIFPWLTVRQNVGFGLRKIRSLSRDDKARRVQEFIGRVGLAGYENYYPSQLSGGMQQRVALARALACQPAVLLMDEPFSAVDALTRSNLQQLVLDLWRDLGLTVVFVTHDVDEAVFLSTRVVALAGRPARVDLDLPVPLAQPRDTVATREDPEFIALRTRLYRAIAETPGTGPGHLGMGHAGMSGKERPGQAGSRGVAL